MKTIPIEKIDPQVHMANYIESPPGRRWGKRSIPDLEYVFLLRGELRYRAEGREIIHFKSPRVLFIEPRCPHLLWVPRGGSGVTIACIHFEFLSQTKRASNKYRLDPEPLEVTRVGEVERIRELFRQTAEVFTGHIRYRDAVLSSLVKTITLHLANIWSGDQPRFSDRLEQMLSYLREHLSEPVSRRDLAREFALTPQYVNHLFKSELGVSPSQYLQRRRVLHAWELINREDLSIGQAALRSGFSDPLYFSKVFKRIFGIPPSKA